MSSEIVDRAEYEQDAVARAKQQGGKIPFTEKHHGKLWSASQEERRGAKPIDEREWFQLFQPLLLEMANTDEGRELLCIPAEYGKIEKFSKNAVQWRTGAFWIDDDGFIQEEWKADFRVGAKWGNVIRYRWREFCKLAKTFYEKEYKGMKIYRPVLNVRGELVAAHATDTSYPDPHVESTTVDGAPRCVAYGSPASWSAVRGASDATESDDSASARTYWAGADNSYWGPGGGNFVSIERGFTLFDTSGISGGNVTAATFSFHVWHTEDDDADATAYVSIVETAPASNTALVSGDYIKCGLGSIGGSFSLGSPVELSDTQFDIGDMGDPNPADVDAYIDWVFNADGRSAISTTGVTKLGGRHGHDITDHPTYAQTGTSLSEYWSYIYGDMADQTGTSDDPKLVVTYSTSDIAEVNTIALASVKKINGITAANIKKLNGITF
jgi:hypothetical protein